MSLSLCQRLVTIALATILSSPSPTEAWQANLKSGGAVQVDQQTRRPMLDQSDGTVPLWNGVHKLEDGSTITVKDGVAVPTENMYKSWSRHDPPDAAPIMNTCELLVRRVCGLQGSCSTSKFCELAKQLQNLEQDARNSTALEMQHNGQEACRKALANAVSFPLCGQDAEIPDAACARLVTRTCGSRAQCKQTPACNAAQQLLLLGQQLRLSGQESAPTGTQCCANAMNNQFFTACQETSAR